MILLHDVHLRRRLHDLHVEQATFLPICDLHVEHDHLATCIIDDMFVEFEFMFYYGGV